VIPDDHVQDLSPAADQDACLAVNAARNAGNLPCQLMGDNPLRGYPPPVEPLDIPDITRLQTGGVAMDFVNGISPRDLTPLKRPRRSVPPGA